MIDSLVRLLPSAEKFPTNSFSKRYALVTLHRPSNVDDEESLKNILQSLVELSENLEIVFPVHPRTRQRLADFGIVLSELHLTEPLPYIEFLALQRRACVVITDSGGIQEETTYLQVPCVTLRTNTERPITVSMGTNTLVGQDMNVLKNEVRRVIEQKPKKGTIPPLWDGKAAERIAKILLP
jgi:UDP-N-acetylglucosamine 2-epimerase (non-hydrolysing)